MQAEIKLSILTPAVPSRWAMQSSLCLSLAGQIGQLPVEHLILGDNKRRTVGEKRDALLRAAKGEYIAFCDDDDSVSEDYVASLLAAIESPDKPDVITFLQRATVNGLPGTVHFSLDNENEEFKPGGITRRKPYHVCCWRRSLAILSHFPAINYGEDLAFCSLLWGLKGLKGAYIDRVLHFYQHSAETSEALPGT